MISLNNRTKMDQWLFRFLPIACRTVRRLSKQTRRSSGPCASRRGMKRRPTRSRSKETRSCWWIDEKRRGWKKRNEEETSPFAKVEPLSRETCISEFRQRPSTSISLMVRFPSDYVTWGFVTRPPATQNTMATVTVAAAISACML